MGLIAIAADTREGIGGGERFHVAAIEAGALAQVSDVGKGALTLCGVNAWPAASLSPLISLNPSLMGGCCWSAEDRIWWSQLLWFTSTGKTIM